MSATHTAGRGRTTITDVARVAGVSVATVSKVINGRDGVAAATSERVMQIVTELGYASSLVATSMRGSRTHVIGVLVAEFEPFALQLLQGVSEALSETAYDVLAYAGAVSSGSHLGWENRSLSRLGGTLIDGAIVVTPTVHLPETNMPIVAIDPHRGPTGPATVDTDNLRGGREATEHLISLGHRRIAHLRGRGDLESARLREQGYREALRAAGIEVDQTLIAEGGYRQPAAGDGAAALFDAADPPTAIFAANDLSAIETMRVAAERGLRVPDDVSIVGFDDVPEAAAATPPLTTVRQPLAAMGRSAVDLLVRMIDDDAEPTHIRMSADLVVRGSTLSRSGGSR
ncbi:MULTISPECIES: LacI family DNA-binding transcriptional regulator [unclassified Microbacterium]|uniref:LacI family DNA-binding transcriptional regulator n=1 Tax=unclassified Microbacterium TaxID=2609290 RepID=UPI00097EBAC9|nr:LacI family DNA-binding transcriptional regulator [Microbacterium sp. JB110]RCS61392.1 LacI family transcriptional regulator [Microbacterium sp. JB110]SJM50129.1 putative transcriptional regulator, LacI family [Frigoribacterium sp. JB110]